MQNYNTIIGVIQMRQDNCPSRSIMERYRIGSGTVSLIINRYASSSLSLQQLQQMSPKDVENTFYPQKNLQRKEIPQPDFQAYYDSADCLTKRTPVPYSTDSVRHNHRTLRA
ncbi:hypothetical protein WMO21_10895 [Lachnospiraceae bacterium CLA-AA-H58]|uniref:hypothetical protein n=1 Tax=Pilosibacter fragilis TaxID=3078042 RepID=UPI0032D431BE